MAAALQEGIYHAPGRRPGRHFALLFLRALPGGLPNVQDELPRAA